MRHLLIASLIFCVSVWSAEYDKIIDGLTKIVDNNTELVQWMDIGKNDQGQDIRGVKIHNPSAKIDGEKRNHLLVGTHHGNERQSAYLCVEAVKVMVEALKDPNHEYHAKLSSYVIYVVPVLNIGGFNAYSRSERDKNGYSHDPNRDYPDPCESNSYFKLMSTQNIANFVERHNILGAVTVHGYIGTFTYPWGMYTSNTKTADHRIYDMIGKECCKINNYRTGTHADVIYPATGAFEDWCYNAHGIWTMLLELSRSANLEKDAQAVAKYFTLVPAERSKSHKHPGKNCSLKVRSNLSRCDMLEQQQKEQLQPQK
ncbi:M14 family zinc carboxypeptidase [Candidatus Uabimicrobium sp. HlEnr_7]|uniref:M14 family zinc carboxypeptidase n=1 Tax=Candidatus Uabimicrobium helgolandensis TaxID=3095367 RepID=UPI003555BFFA